MGRKVLLFVVAASILNASVPKGVELEVGSVGLSFGPLYRGATAQLELYPLLVVRYKNFYFEGLLAGYRLYRDRRLSVAIEVVPTLNDYESDISSFLAGMEDRKAAWETGFDIDYALDKGRFSAKLMRDWQGVHRGWGLVAEYGKNLVVTDRGLTAGYLGAEYSDPLKSNYYYGVQPKEARSWRPAYKAGGAVASFVGLTHFYQIGKQISCMGNLEYRHFDNAVTDSPIVGRHYQLSAYAGFLYKIQ